ncbi:acyl-CoA carboxylase subunit epsilon [Oryzobacter terrae]|uniref:acyl-CoA carboxylase subunit epsilon n=1 Tax=Oryzobacter terrae TaxID=1620385 RepID=UPI00366FEFD3
MDTTHPTTLTVTGGATPEEVAAIVTVLGALSGADDTAPEPVRSRWASPRATMRTPVGRGPGAWQASTRP